MTDGRLLSWSSDFEWNDRTLRIWDSWDGICLATLEGHTDSVSGAYQLTDGRLLSWSADKTLRIWDSQSGVCLADLEGHSGGVQGALEAAEAQLLSWSDDNTMRLWNGQTGECVEVLQEQQVAIIHPEWIHARARVANLASVIDALCIVMPDRMARLYHRNLPGVRAAWNAEAGATARCLLPDGTGVVTQDNGQVCFVKLYHGNRRIYLAELEALLEDSTGVGATLSTPNRVEFRILPKDEQVPAPRGENLGDHEAADVQTQSVSKPWWTFWR